MRYKLSPAQGWHRYQLPPYALDVSLAKEYVLSAAGRGA